MLSIPRLVETCGYTYLNTFCQQLHGPWTVWACHFNPYDVGGVAPGVGYGVGVRGHQGVGVGHAGVPG